MPVNPKHLSDRTGSSQSLL